MNVPEKRMRLVMELARRNIRRKKGGPFGAAVFDLETGELLGQGVNQVVAANDPTAHAEINAIREACRRRKSFSLKEAGVHAAIYTTADPCGMCCTALVWAGIGEIYSSASTGDVQAIGFDEGLKPSTWVSSLKRRGIRTTRGLLREEAVRILREYKKCGGRLYNGRRASNR